MPRAVWKGTAPAESDDTVVVDGQTIRDAGWYYPRPSAAAAAIAGRVAFGQGVRVRGAGTGHAGPGGRVGQLRRLFGARTGAARP